jgi:glycosyltransferase involved in cell wall biosynthesis
MQGRSSPERSISDLPFVSVIVPHYRDLAGLNLCLSALAAQTYPKDRFEVVVADNASPEGPELVGEAIGGRARLVVVSERGAGPARNGGVAVAKAAVLAFTDSDCVPEPQWLIEGIRALDRYDRLRFQNLH